MHIYSGIVSSWNPPVHLFIAWWFTFHDPQSSLLCLDFL